MGALRRAVTPWVHAVVFWLAILAVLTARDAERQQAPGSAAGTALLRSRLAYHLAALREDATNADVPTLERLALVRERAEEIATIRRDLDRGRTSRG